ncbi:insulinase family protein [Paramaledivibacter caminithermalis]|jgi:Zn-dependent M16 (insulinase) family peptidase|uniref:Peptidase M16C associated domain-containing protein n=1 Tax=Paramaledivibacter caminithermalis (strain DSM 15212 / CIP 107654 / DViRD3) TaxID=1121301 RepID=A0A1M6SB59_PARC5|nr:insulinase family protein [Paramaledivibacter caminithermalis]SHK41951.1 hypothetical protein SAMN02745912_03250 [Paramaledivibacter caminithermalis DSM 15212]
MLKTDLREGMRLYGFTVEFIKELKEYDAVSIELSHDITGMKVWHLYCDNHENLFAYIVKTLPDDNRGIPHVLEHCVLRGSKRFPSNDPFSYLLKSSMSTYLNAWTMPDKTVYLGSSINYKDFFNLMIVIGDAVFSPLLREKAFYEEAFCISNKMRMNNDMEISGVVFNEILSKYSSQIPIVRKHSIQSVFPDVSYRFDHGGVPAEIIDLSNSDIKAFHKKWYHPSNSRVFVAGAIRTEEHLKILSNYILKNCLKSSIDQERTLRQPRWRKPRFIECSCPENISICNNDKIILTMNWLMESVTDVMYVTVMEILSEILTGNEGAVLRRALLKSKLVGEIHNFTGVDTDYSDVVYSLSMGGIKEEDICMVERVVFDELNKIVKKGIDEQNIRAAVHTVRIRNKEIKRIGGPYTLMLLRRALNGWSNGLPPHKVLAFDLRIKNFEDNVKQDMLYLSKFIEKNFLLNLHRSTVLIRPDSAYVKKHMAYIKEKVSLMHKSDFKRLNKEMIENSEEKLQLPYPLSVRDIPRNLEKYPVERDMLLNTIPIYWNDIYTNDIVYIDILFDIKNLPKDLHLLLLFWGKAMVLYGLPEISYEKAALLLSDTTGGIHFCANAGKTLDNSYGYKAYCMFSFKCFHWNFDEALNLVVKLLNKTCFYEEDRLKELYEEYRNNRLCSMASNAGSMVTNRVKSRLSEAYMLEDIWDGVEQICYLKNARNVTLLNIDEIAENLNRMTSLIIDRDSMVLNVTTQKEYFPNIRSAFKNRISLFPKGCRKKLISRKTIQGFQGKTEIMLTSCATSFVGKALRGAAFGTKEEVSQKVLAHMLKTGYLWKNVRQQNGTYGVQVISDGFEGIFALMSMYDPCINETLQVFEKAFEYLKNAELTDDRLKQSIFGVLGQELTPLSPFAKGRVALNRQLFGMKEKLLEMRHEYFLTLGIKDLKKCIELLQMQLDKSYEVILTNETEMKHINKCGVDTLYTYL